MVDRAELRRVRLTIAVAPLLALSAACHSRQPVRPADIRPNATLEVRFRSPTDLPVTRAGVADTLRQVRVVSGQYRASMGDTVVMRATSYLDRRGNIGRVPTGVEVRVVPSMTGPSAGAELREVKFSGKRTAMAVLLPVAIPVAGLLLLLSL